MEGRFTFDDFLEQMQQLKKMGPASGIIGMLPGIPKEVRNMEIDDGQLAQVEAIIRSMTVKERAEPETHRRIAQGPDRQGFGNPNPTSGPAGQTIL